MHLREGRWGRDGAYMSTEQAEHIITILIRMNTTQAAILAVLGFLLIVLALRKP